MMKMHVGNAYISFFFILCMMIWKCIYEIYFFFIEWIYVWI